MAAKLTGIPTLATARLVLRPLREADFPAFRDFLASPRSGFIGGPYSGWAAWGMFCHEIACWDLFGHGGLLIERRQDGAAMGVVEINAGPLYPEPELGWTLYAGFEGQGYATEAAAALLRWGFRTAGLVDIVSYCDPANSRSIAVARRLDGVLDPVAPRQDAEDLVFRYHPADEA
jgi:RimJ/RimL family protein N-acetyltransferase